MTTVLAPDMMLGGGLDRGGWESFDLLDRFWDSVAFHVEETTSVRNSLQDFDDLAIDCASMPTPEIFSKAGSNLMVNIRADGRLLAQTTWSDSQLDSSWSTFTARPPSMLDHEALQYKYGDKQCSANPPSPIALTISPSIAVQAQPRWSRTPRLTIPSNQKRQSETVSSPGSALLNLASEFLGAIVRIGRSQPSTPVPVPNDDSVSIVTSEVSVCVVDEDEFRGRQRSVSEYRDSDGVEWVESIPFSSIYSAVPICGDGMNAEEADILAKMSWERQLMDAEVF